MTRHPTNHQPRCPLLLALILPATLVAGAGAPGAVAQHVAVESKVDNLADLERLFRDPPADARIMMRWWWFGPAVTTGELEREMRAMRDAGIGGFEVQPVYPVALDAASGQVRTLPFLSDGFIEALRFASAKSRELGLRMDLTLGSGWPYGGPQVTIDRAAGRLRVERVKVPEGAGRVMVPDIGAGERLIAAFLVDSAGPREVTDIADGVLRLPPASTAAREALFFIGSRTGQMVKRAAVNAEGFVVDHYDRAAIDHYLADVGDPLLRAFGENPPYAIFCDSLEVYESDWTSGFLDEFRRRRGYDLRSHLPALAMDVGAETGALRHDWGQTLTELVDEHFLAPMQDWAKSRGTRFRVQAYGIPPATIWSNRLADLPEGEGIQWKGLSATRWAASAGHIFGRPVISSETWTWLHSPSFRATPLDMKAEADLHFLQGINQLVGHGWPYSPENAAYPGWRFYAAGVFDDKNPWWIVMPDVSKYLQRVSFVLRQGQAVNDVALYLPIDDAWARFEPGHVGSLIDGLSARLGPDIVGRVLESGFNLDFIDDEVLRRAGHMDAGALAAGQGRYRVVILPGLERISPDTLKQLEAFARSGGVLVATRRLPDRAPGFLASAGDHDQVRASIRRLFEAPDAPGIFVKDERRVGEVVAGRLPPDVALSSAEPEIGFVHRRTDSADIYFVANTGNTERHLSATFRASRASVQLWRPLSGAVSPLPTQGRSAGTRGMSVALDLEPYESVLVVFTDGAPARAARPPAARRRLEPFPALDLSTGWLVRFGDGGAPRAFDRLRSWTDDPETRDFSGVATYEKTVDVPAGMLAAGRRVQLDFGETRPVPPVAQARQQAWLEAPVREAAVVYVNGQRVGAVWCPPYALEVGRLLKAGPNTIRIEVANLAVNYMASRALPDYKLLNRRYGVRFEPQDMDKLQPVTAGLVGTIRLVGRN